MDTDGKVIGNLNVVACGPTTWDWKGERDMFLNYSKFLSEEFGQGQGVIIDHSWWGYPYYLLTGGELVIDEKRKVTVPPHPKLKLCHVIHGVTGWRRGGNDYVPPPGVQFPRIMGVSRTHAAYLSNCFKLPVRYVFNGVDIPEITAGEGKTTTTTPYLLSLNRISREKGIHNAIDVCLATKTPLKVVGDDTHVSDQNYVFDIMDRCAKSGGLIEYVGTVDNDRKWDYIKDSRALITCPDTSNYVESFYMAAVEGWSQGKPILSLPNGGLADIVIDGVNGFLASNPEEMKDILVNGKEVYIEDPNTNNTYYKNILKLEDINPDKIKQEANRYSVENMAKGYMDICKGVLENDPAYNW